MALALVSKYNTHNTNVQAGVAVSTGDLIIVGYTYSAALASVSASDNAAGGSNTYNQAGSGVSATTGTGALQVFYAIAKATETLSVACTSQTGAQILVHIVSGNNTTLSSVLDGTPATSTSSYATSFTSGSVTTTNANDYIFVFWASAVGGTSTGLVENGTGFTIEINDTYVPYASADRIVSATGTYHESTTTDVNTPYNSIIAAFKAASGGATAYTLTAATGTFALTGETATRDFAMPGAQGAFALTGHAATAGYGLGASEGAFGLTGNAATLNWSGAPVPKGSRGAHWSLTPAIGLCV